ncbi:MAG: hypothetical protein HC831_26160 [Chloroflexia bacterium]|nr:hypothetical protein [Chloroflexia bacterium]
MFESRTSAIENRKSFIIDNSKSKKEKFCRIKVDGCLIKDKQRKKCDYVFVRCSTKDFYFVELKGGGHTEMAFEQLKNTIHIFRNKFDLKIVQVSAYIVSGSIPSGSNQRFRNLIKRFKTETGVVPTIKTNKLVKKYKTSIT